MRRTTNRRMPLSCEPCRLRKIRCSRDGAGSCQSCIRRGIPPVECIFLRELRARQAYERGRREPSNQDLVQRVRKLEDLLTNASSVPSDDPRDEPASQYSATASHQGSSKSQPSSPPVREAGLRRVVGSDGSLLLRSSSGHEHYEPFFSQWYSTTNSASLPDGLYSEIGDSNADDEFPFSSKRPQRDELLSLLPPMSSCDVLKDTYLKVFARLFHILHDPSFCSDYERFRADPEGVSLSWLALLFATLSVAVVALEEEDADLLHDLGRTTSVSKNVSILTSRYRAAAMQALEADNYLWRHNLYTLQALVIIIYGINHSHGSSWTLLGLARNIAFSLGCHVDPDNFGLGLVEAEERRRCWAAVSMLYTIQNSTLGNLDPTSLPADVRLPLDVDDDKIVDDALMPMGSKVMPSQMSYLLHKFRLYDICSKICSQVLSKRSSISYAIVHELDEAILGQHEAWNLQYLTDTQRSSLSDTHTVHLDILFGYSYQLLLLLHRPIIMQYFGSSSARASYSRVQMQKSRLRCLESARSLLAIHRRAHESRPFQPYQWYNAGLGSFHAFHAAVTIAYILGVSPDLDEVETEQLRKEIEDSLDIFHILAACGKSRICQKALPILRRLCEVLYRSSAAAAAPTQIPVHSTSTEAWGCSRALSSNVDQQHLAMFLESLQPQPWLSPSMINWNDWDSFIAG